MKKAYSKPQIAFDSFELSQSIAGGCKMMASHAQYVCGMQFDTDVIFNDTYGNACTMEPQDLGLNICYDVPQEAWRLFSS